MKNVLRSIARALRSLLVSMGAVMRRLLGLPEPGPDVEVEDIADVGLDAVTESDVRESYSLTLAKRIREAAAARLRGQDWEVSFSASEGYEAAWLGRLSESQLERVSRMLDADILGHVSGERVVAGILPVLRMRWIADDYLPAAEMDPPSDPNADCGIKKTRPKTKLSGIVRRIDESEYELIECGVEGVFREWRERMDREAAEAERDTA